MTSSNISLSSAHVLPDSTSSEIDIEGLSLLCQAISVSSKIQFEKLLRHAATHFEEVERPKLDARDASKWPQELCEFTAYFKKSGSQKLHLPIKRLAEWVLKYQDIMWIERTDDNHLELLYDRPKLIKKFTTDSTNDAALRTVQNFERCLQSVKPKLITLASTHKKPIKRIGFESPETVFGTPRSAPSIKEERAKLRKIKYLQNATYS